MLLVPSLILTIATSILAKPQGRIIGGQLARASQFPYSAAIYLKTVDGQYFCAGGLLNTQWIITAAHCVDNVVMFTIQLGSNTLSTEDPNRLTVATTNAITHPNYNPATYDNDLGLIKLNLPIKLNIDSDNIGTLSLPSQPLGEDEIVTVAGWGQTSDFDPTLSNDLMYVILSTISNEKCQQTYGSVVITDNMVCTMGNYNEGTCIGDSGNALVKSSIGGDYTIVAVASFLSRNGCETVDPSGYIRIHPYKDWITGVIG